ncbi:ABC-type transport auxiliary lipoprotein family protein [Thermophagus sp. OGC60D27]|uniref:ABC-type transport auxiliary lipoprotein family protein n=1 Tax=Thermophagus sp. OGC60D27 TaxID=3458415 RepID=UPI0040378626
MRQKLLFILLITVFLMAGCGSQKTVIRKYYTLEQPDTVRTPFVKDTILFNARCEVEDVVVYPAYATRKIVFRDDSHQIRYFEEHEWAVQPKDILTPIIIDFMTSKNLFLKVSDRFWKHTPQYRIQTTIYRIEVAPAENKKKFTAHLEVRFELTNAQSEETIISHFANRQSQLEKGDLNLMAASISDLFYEELNNFSLKIKDKLSNREAGD